jgi:hypothetical protein
VIEGARVGADVYFMCASLVAATLCFLGVGGAALHNIAMLGYDDRTLRLYNPAQCTEDAAEGT